MGQDDLGLLGVNLRKAFPLPDTKEFEELLQTIERLEAHNPSK
jgi:hypothetical protein